METGGDGPDWGLLALMSVVPGTLSTLFTLCQGVELFVEVLGHA